MSDSHWLTDALLGSSFFALLGIIRLLGEVLSGLNRANRYLRQLTFRADEVRGLRNGEWSDPGNDAS